MKAVAYIRGDYTRASSPGCRAEMYDALARPLSYEVKGSEFSAIRREGEWDGRKRLVWKSGPNAVRIPTGLWPMAKNLLVDRGFAIDERHAYGKPRKVAFGAWGSFPLRGYQGEAVRGFLGPLRAHFDWRGVLKMPIRSGKTLTAAYIARASGLRTLFIATSDFLVEQAFRVFEDALPGATITAVGGGMGDDASGDVVVMSIATLAARAGGEWFKSIRDSFGLVICDEVHHICAGATEWRDAVIKIRAPSKLGLSGTLDEGDAGIRLWARAICGPTVYEVPMRQMVEDGHLMEARVDFLRYETPTMGEKAWTAKTTYRDGIVNCLARNSLIVVEAVREVEAGHRVLIDCRRVGHARGLGAQLRALLPHGQAVVLVGASKDKDRKKALAGLLDGRVRVIVSTVMGEGVDVPGLEVVINASGGKGGSAMVQRLRNLTTAPGKTYCRVVEPFDAHHPTLVEWTRSRASMYRALGCFDLRVL